MPGATPLPNQGDVFFDSGRPDRSLRISRHADAGVVVLSIWNGGVCLGTFRLAADQIGMFTQVLLSSPEPAHRDGAPPVETGRREPYPADPPPSFFVTGQYDTAPTLP
jgi:hypothetical protein